MRIAVTNGHRNERISDRIFLDPVFAASFIVMVDFSVMQWTVSKADIKKTGHE